MLFNTFVFLYSQIIDDLSIVDITWGLMFIIPNSVLVYHRVYVREEEFTTLMKLTLAMVALWGVRLSLHIGLRHKGEDYRYKFIKKRWAHRSAPARFIWAFLYIFGMQGLFSMVVNASALHVMRYSQKDD